MRAGRAGDGVVMKRSGTSTGARLRIVLGPDIAIGPGKADLLEGIRATGSIAGAGRAMGMSYKRAWMLVESMNGCFRAPLVTTSRGGAAGGGASLTDEGALVLAVYRRMEAETERAIAGEMGELRRMLRQDDVT